MGADEEGEFESKYAALFAYHYDDGEGSISGDRVDFTSLVHDWKRL